MKSEVIADCPSMYFAETKIDESRLLDLSFSPGKIRMIIDYAGATFDWKERIVHQSVDFSVALPNKDFRLLMFERVKNTILALESGLSDSDASRFSISLKPGPTVIYCANCRKSATGYCFEVMSNKFEHLSFDFESLRSLKIIARPELIKGNWAYFSVPQGRKVDILKPFALETDE
jgi:hypothetical protein